MIKGRVQRVVFSKTDKTDCKNWARFSNCMTYPFSHILRPYKGLPRFILESVIHDYPWKSNQIQKADTERWYISSSQGSIHLIHLRPQPWDPWTRLNAAWSNGSMALRRANKALAQGDDWHPDMLTTWKCRILDEVGICWKMLEYVGCVLDMFLDFHWYVHPLDWELNGYPPFFWGKFNRPEWYPLMVIGVLQ